MGLVKCLSAFSYQTPTGPRTVAGGELLDDSDPAVVARRSFFSPTEAQQLVNAVELGPDVAAELAAHPAFTGTFGQYLAPAYGTTFIKPHAATALHVTDPSGTYGDAVVFGNVAALGMGNAGSPGGQYAPLGIYQRYGDFTSGSGAPITKTTQGFFVVTSYYGPCSENSAESASAIVLLKSDLPGGGSNPAFTQSAHPVTASEFDVMIEGSNQVSGTYSACVGARTEMSGAGSYAATSHGFYLYANTGENTAGYGSVGAWRGFTDLKYNPATGAPAASESIHGANRVTSEQALYAGRSGYAGVLQADLAGSIGGEAAGSTGALLRVQQTAPNNTTTVNDGAFTSGSPRMTTATAPGPTWIGRVVANANVPAGTQVKNYYGAGPYTVVLTANATATASSQTVTVTEPDLVGLRIVQGSGGLQRPLEYWATSASYATFGVSRVGAVFAQNSFQVINSAGTAQAGIDSGGYKVYAAGLESTGAGSAALGANCPAVTATAPYKWFKAATSDGSVVYIPAWK